MVKIYNFHSSRILILLFELFISFCSFLFSAFIFKNKFNFDSSDFIVTISIVLIVKFLIFILLKTHITVLRYTSYKDIFRLFISISISSFLLFFINNLLKSTYVLYSTSNFVLLFDYFLCLMFIIGYRLAIRFIISESEFNSKELITKNIAIIGTGYQAILTKHFLDYERDTYKYKVRAYFTNDDSLIGKKIEDGDVYHISKMSTLIEILNIDTIIVMEYKEYSNSIESIKNQCAIKDIQIVENQNVRQWVNLSPKKNIQKEFKIEDLLNRDSIQLDLNNISRQIKDKVIVVSGAAGSIGSEMCKQILKFDPKKLILIDQAESPLYDIENQLLITHKDKIKSYIASVFDMNRMEWIFQQHQPQIVFHAAAYKHVPLMENNPYEAIKTNLIGTKRMADVAVKFNVDKFIFISTDKAVNPTNVMGATKRAAEMYIQSLNHVPTNKTKFITTRFGNVLGSNGSVIPIFKKQIEHGGPVMVTHPDITRFFMTIPEACQLVLEAGAIGDGSDIYIFDMGESVKIIDLAKNMIEMYGYKVDEEIKIEFSGLRPGEKLYEELLADKENTLPTHNPKIMIAKISFTDFEKVAGVLNQMEHLIGLHSDNYLLVKTLKELIPEYKSNNSEFETLDA